MKSICIAGLILGAALVTSSIPAHADEQSFIANVGQFSPGGLAP